MKTYPKLLAAALLLLTLTACQTAPVQTVYRDKYVPIPKALLAPCPIVSPPKYSTYARLKWGLKEQSWMQYSTDQINELNTCNQRTQSLIDWDQKQSALYQ